ncbi:MAG: bifunctional demethylmenaquinone methyltransferase/2-methoxy-6-polyprenyl-1,4-benzoquinol methylase UbiE [Calditrichia bacterium]
MNKKDPAIFSDKTQPPSRREVWRMFDRIARRYDFLNRTLSLGRDVAWRNRIVANLPEGGPLRVLDLATGTGDVLLTLLRENPGIELAAGIDMAREMLRIGRRKISEKGFDHSVYMIPADAMALPFRRASFEVLTIAFGIRNVQEVDTALREMKRLLRSGGRMLILEFSLPENPLMRKLYLFYFRHILPRIGGMISGDQYAYRYLNQTVETFPYGEEFCRLMRLAGFGNVRAIPLTFGIATLYRGDA